jgi:hypothetical protein
MSSSLEDGLEIMFECVDCDYMTDDWIEAHRHRRIGHHLNVRSHGPISVFKLCLICGKPHANSFTWTACELSHCEDRPNSCYRAHSNKKPSLSAFEKWQYEMSLNLCDISDKGKGVILTKEHE